MNKASLTWSAKTLVNQMKKGNVNFDNAIQRSLVWDIGKKSLLIHSMVYDYAIPPMYFTRDDQKTYDSLDGKQRSNAISEYMNDEFALTEDTPPVYTDKGEEVYINGLTFSELPEWVQDRIKDYSLTIYYYDDMTDAEAREFFRRLNNGKPLSAVELTRVNTPCLEVFQRIAKHDAIQKVVSAAGKKRFTDENIAMQIYHMATVKNPDFSTKAFREWAKNIQTDETVVNKIMCGLDAYLEFLDSLDQTEDKKLLRAIKTRTHFVSCVFYCYLVYQDKTQAEINEILGSFFAGNPSISPKYNSTVGSGSAKPAAVAMRQNIMLELAGVSLEDCLKEIEEEEAQAEEQAQEPQEEEVQEAQAQDTAQVEDTTEWTEAPIQEPQEAQQEEPQEEKQDSTEENHDSDTDNQVEQEAAIEVGADFFDDVGGQMEM